MGYGLAFTGAPIMIYALIGLGTVALGAARKFRKK